MKITKIILLLFAFLCTSNVWAQLNKDEYQDLITGNRVIKDMKIQVSNSGWNGTVSITLDGKLLCADYDQGILLLEEWHFIERTSKIDVYPGGVLSIWGNKNGSGKTNVISLTIPEDAIDPILIVECTPSTHFPLNAHFSGH